MTIDRSAVATYLDEQFSQLAAAVGQNAMPTSGYKPDIDSALRELGKSEGELAAATVEDADRKAYFALAKYFAAERIWIQLGSRVNTRTGLNSYDFDGQRKQAKEIMEQAKQLCALLGYDVTGAGWTVGSLNTDWIEPEMAVDA